MARSVNQRVHVQCTYLHIHVDMYMYMYMYNSTYMYMCMYCTCKCTCTVGHLQYKSKKSYRLCTIPSRRNEMEAVITLVLRRVCTCVPYHTYVFYCTVVLYYYNGAYVLSNNRTPGICYSSVYLTQNSKRTPSKLHGTKRKR